ncbi:methionine ABC transporter ATP-binding protein [Motilibacter aurantiacus]|uniref:methionine ABC transporter ATP-binding protein n=1 Tax=Motilibacter aurantiacus TaxID=2714955 RepID=UPI00140A9835|nr:ATP-binding cassette domain-containing protein [Motilibacter aurantiacus]
MITVQDLRKAYRLGSREILALRGVSLHIPRGEIHGVVGPSGAGKSTLVRCLTVVERPTSGSVTVDGKELTALGERELRTARRSIGMVFQNVNLLDNRTAAQNVAHPLELARVPRERRKERVAELLELVGLGDRGAAYPSQLSGGQRQRIGIARALAAEPSVLLCDEPTSALDARTTHSILQLIRDVRDRLGVTVILITHEPAVVKEACDSVSRLHDGRIVQQGPVAEALTAPESELAHDLLPLVTAASDARAEDVVDITFSGDAKGTELLSQLARRFDVDARIVAATVETHRGRQYGRMRLGFGPGAPMPQILEFLAGNGVAAEVVR